MKLLVEMALTIPPPAAGAAEAEFKSKAAPQVLDNQKTEETAQGVRGQFLPLPEL